MPGLRTPISDSSRLAEGFRCSVAGRVQALSSSGIHHHAQEAAEAAEAAAAQGKFWEMHALLFERQNAASHEGSDPLRRRNEPGC
jgi:hypothetical protein